MIQNPYLGEKIKYKLDDEEIKKIDHVWKFIKYFRSTKISRSKYRKYMINKIKLNYTTEEFYKYEIIIEKMYWNLFYKIKNDIVFDPKIYIKKNFNLKYIINNILKKNNNIKESNVRKTFIICDDIILYKYDYPNNIDKLLYSIMINRGFYETIMLDDKLLYKFDLKPYNNNIEFDYAFPNLNTIKEFTKSTEIRLENIKKMYYDVNAEKYWFV
jgi:hypothetical protein